MVVAALRTELLFVPGPKAALGVGGQARATLGELLVGKKPRAVAIVGYAGGLRPQLEPGDLVLAERILDEDGVVEVDAELLFLARQRLPWAHAGPLFTDRRLTPREEKAELAKKALAVDMETSFLVRELRARGIPFLAARVILDTEEEEVQLGWRAAFWAGRALRCSRVLGRAAEGLRAALGEALCAA